jgi:hypothetical protein
VCPDTPAAAPDKFGRQDQAGRRSNAAGLFASGRCVGLRRGLIRGLVTSKRQLINSIREEAKQVFLVHQADRFNLTTDGHGFLIMFSKLAWWRFFCNIRAR